MYEDYDGDDLFYDDLENWERDQLALDREGDYDYDRHCSDDVDFVEPADEDDLDRLYEEYLADCEAGWDD